MKIKNTVSKLNENLKVTLPLIEEITKKKMIPFCLIAFNPKINKKDKIIYTHWATVSDEMDKMLVEMCKQMVELKSPKKDNSDNYDSMMDALSQCHNLFEAEEKNLSDQGKQVWQTVIAAILKATHKT